MRSWVCALALVASPLPAQWSISEVVRRAGEKYAGVEVSFEQAAAAAASLQQARAAYLPRGDFYAQLNRATRNNVYGMTLPNAVIPAISGPPLAANAGTSVWGTTTGFLVQWEPFDLGQRDARLATSELAGRRAQLAYARTRFEVEAAAADAYLTTLAAAETINAAQAARARAASLAEITAAQARAGLKPEADAARARAELAAADAQLIRARNAHRLARISVAQLTAAHWEDVLPTAAFALKPPPANAPPALAHPALREQALAVKESASRKHEADIAWRPRFNTQAALYARGTGANPDFTTGGPAAGLGPNIYNWGVGFSVLFPFLDLPNIRARQLAESHNARAESARLRKLTADLESNLQRAAAAEDEARALAATIPAQLDAARSTEAQARARYSSGLASITDVADAQRLLAQAEIDQALATLNLWRARLAAAAAAGDLQPFLEAAK